MRVWVDMLDFELMVWWDDGCSSRGTQQSMCSPEGLEITLDALINYRVSGWGSECVH